ncbi:MAG: DUF308 domain-containing protein [Clostridia bacterium]|nr:DUF308 domain-containing protein [Clostridia bacterium]
MKVLNAIVGVLALIASIYTFAFPGVTFLKTGWFVTILLCVWGACALFTALSDKKDANSKQTLGSAILALLGGVGTALLTTLSIFHPGLSLILDIVVVDIFAVWLMLSGISGALSAVKILKPTGNSLWILSLILGVLTAIAGLYGIFHLILMAQTIGILLGVLMMLYGVRLLASLFEYKA